MLNFLSAHLFLAAYLLPALLLTVWTSYLLGAWIRYPEGRLPLLADSHFAPGYYNSRDWPTKGDALGRYVVGFVPFVNVFALIFCTLLLIFNLSGGWRTYYKLADYFEQPAGR